MGKVFSISVSNIESKEVCDGDFLRLDMYAISDGRNRNDSNFKFEGFEKSIDSIYNKPILAYFNKDINDTEEHNSDVDMDEFGNVFDDYQYEGAEKPVGTIPESAEITIKEKDGKKWIFISGAVIWTEYNKQLVKLIKKQLKKKVSVEIEVLESYIDEDCVECITHWRFLGITILGKTPFGEIIEEGIEGAHLSIKDYQGTELFSKYKKHLSFALNKENKNNILFKYINDDLETKKNMALTHKELESRIWAELSDYIYQDADCTMHKYWIQDILSDKDIAIVHDNEYGMDYQIPFTIDDEEKVHIDLSEKKVDKVKHMSVTEFKIDKEVYLSKKEWGTGNSIAIDKSKESVSDERWGGVNKSNLRNIMLKAKNYKQLIKAAYLLVEEGWEDSPSGKLKYPVMQIVGDKLVYNAGGLLSAEQYGEKYDETIAKKAKSLRKKLGLTGSKREETMKSFIESAKESGYTFLGLHNGKLKFTKEVEATDEDKKEMSIFEVDKEKCAKDEEFSEDKLDCKAIKFEDDDEDDDDDDGEKPEDKKPEDTKVKESKEYKDIEKEKNEMALKCADMEKELKVMKDEKFKDETDKVLEADENIDKESKDELIKMRDEDKFATVEDFVKELAFKKYTKQDSKKLSYSVNKPVVSPTSKGKASALDIISKI